MSSNQNVILNNHRKPDTIDAIHKSWLEIKRLEEWVIIAATKSDWSNVVAICKKRHVIINEHFSRFPVSPETSFFYTKNLNNHFTAEHTINVIRKNAVRSSLSIVQ